MEYSDRFENFWLRYKSSQKGPKRTAYKSWGKVCATWAKEENIEGDAEVAFSQHVFRGYDAVIRNRKAAERARQFVPGLPHVTTWLNQYRFEEEQAVSAAEYRDRTPGERVCDCGETRAIIGRSYSGGWNCRACDILAWKAGETYMHIKPSLQPMLDRLPKLAGETWREWSIRSLAQTDVGRALAKRYGIEIMPDTSTSSVVIDEKTFGNRQDNGSLTTQDCGSIIEEPI